MALEVGIVGLPSSGKSMLFEALTGAKAQNEVGMAAIPDPRLQQLADVVHARKVTPAAIRVSEVRGTGPALLGNLRQVDALLVVLDGFSGTHVPADDLETLKLELLVADRDHVEKRLERIAKQARSGDANLRKEVEELEKLLAHSTPARRWPTGRGAAARARAADDEAADRDRERAERHRPEARGRARRALRRGGRRVPRQRRVRAERVVRRLADTLALITFFTAARRTRAPGRSARARPRSRPPTRSTPTSRAASSAAR
jgi:Predicted GTPase, probable translation factor